MASNLTLRGFFHDTKPIWEMGLGGILAVFLAESAIHLQWIAAHLIGSVRIIVILAACYALYLVRHFFRLAYGFLEILVGLLVIIGSMTRKPELLDPSLLLVQLAAGMYVIIRGFDNFGQSTPFTNGGAAFRVLWNLMKALRLRKTN
jgi:hypothetical protein